jgi:transposase InsO family protein
MDSRDEFIAAHSSGLYTVSELCKNFKISRKTGHKWIRRNREQGIEGLLNASRARHTQAQKTAQDICDAIIICRRKHPDWGGRKVLDSVRNSGQIAADRLPCAATAVRIIRDAGLLTPRRRRNKNPHPGLCPLIANEPNQVWSVDYKGEYLCSDGKWAYPLTVEDACTRELILCRVLPNTRTAGAKQSLTETFKSFGLPMAIRTDNGAPFCSPAIAGISQLSVWWLKLGIRHDRIPPSSPQENGRHERMHRTLKGKTAFSKPRNLRELQARCDAFREEYNDERPHESLGGKTPGSMWYPSPRQLPDQLLSPQYPEHMIVRSVRKSGQFKFMGNLLFLSQVLAGEKIGLEETEDGVWSIYHYQMMLGKLDQSKMKIVHGHPSGKTACKSKWVRP